jgi:Protein of unknown function (DUF3024)
MPLPPLVRRLAEVKITKYCDALVPPHLKDQIRHTFGFRGNSLTLFERRPHFQKKSVWTKLSVAQFRYSIDDRTWTLYWADRNSRWHVYDRIPPASKLDDLLDEVDDDPTCIFWG